MWLRLALNFFVVLFLFSACLPQDRQAADKLNSLSYAYHYRNLDSTECYAREAYRLSAADADGRAQALNNLAFVSITRMQYELAKAQLDSVESLTDNQLELLIANIQQMRLCQRRSHNREFYDYRENALRSLARINEERSWLTGQQHARLCYAESELAIVTSTYYYYVGLEQQSIMEIEAIGPEVEGDTAQWMNYLYNVGAGGILTQGSQVEIEQQEFECLAQCYLLAVDFGSAFFLGNSLEAMAEHLEGEESRARLAANNPLIFERLGLSTVNPNDLAVVLAEQALTCFQEYGDVYQIAGAYRTLASCHRAKGEHEQALGYLELSLADSVINQAPDLVASIREQLSVAFSAVNDKPMSDYNRNIYLDLQEQTRQDRSLEARAGQLDAAVDRLNILLIAVAVALVLLLLSLRFFYLYYKRRQQRQEQIDELEMQREELQEQLLVGQQKKQDAERRNLEQRAKISLVNSIMPLVDRMLHDVRHLDDKSADNASSADGLREEKLQYIRELTDKINEQNNVLTHWIQLRQGELNLHVETFALQPLFDLIEKGRRSFTLNGIELTVDATTARVKADRVLTIFMLNTLADNARKFTPEGGRVHVYATEAADYVEISVADTGQGMDEDQLAHIFEHKVTGGHGFGLLNCKGIIEKYKKTSQLFAVCRLAAESRKGEGSRFFFRLPKGVVRLLLLLCLSTASLSMGAATQTAAAPLPTAAETLLQKASSLADSTYYSNISGTYGQTVLFADSCLSYLNRYYRTEVPDGNDTLRLFDDASPAIPEVAWLHEDLPLNYNILLSVRNECAVAALALHEWELYQYNNRIYTSLFKELSADPTLDAYCRRMSQVKSNVTVAIVMLVLIVVALIVALAFQIVQAMGRRAARQQIRQEQLELLSDERRRLELEEARLHVSNQVLENCLSTLKHETMYYPSRIRQLIDAGDTSALTEVVGYYRELYGILSQQADRQVSGAKLHLQPLDHEILGDPTLIGYLFEILRKQAHEKQLQATFLPKDDDYVECRVAMSADAYTDFMPSVANIPYLLCRQIVREHGEATGRRACGIRAERQPEGVIVTIVLPRQRTASRKL